MWPGCRSAVWTGGPGRRRGAGGAARGREKGTKCLGPGPEPGSSPGPLQVGNTSSGHEGAALSLRSWPPRRPGSETRQASGRDGRAPSRPPGPGGGTAAPAQSFIHESINVTGRRRDPSWERRGPHEGSGQTPGWRPRRHRCSRTGRLRGVVVAAAGRSLGGHPGVQQARHVAELRAHGAVSGAREPAAEAGSIDQGLGGQLDRRVLGARHLRVGRREGSGPAGWASQDAPAGTPNLGPHVCACACACACVSICVRVCACVSACACVSICVCACVSVCACMKVCACAELPSGHRRQPGGGRRRWRPSSPSPSTADRRPM